MKEDKFIELLNLYLDNEITLEDAAKLETEIQKDPRRRDIYRQYCRMQKGCAMLAENFTSAQPTAAFASEKSKPNRGYAGWYLGAAALAAACLAVVVVIQPDEAVVTPEQPLAESETAPVVAAAKPEMKAAPRLSLPVFPDNDTKLQTVFTPRLINTPDTAESARAFFARETADGFDWMERVRLDPLEAEAGDMEFRVESTLEPKTRTYRSRRPIEGQVEMTAFQFQR